MTEARIQAPKGVPEYYPPLSADFLAVRDGLTAPAQHAGYGYIELPVFEDTSLYVRGVGESTDVVSKEMYTFTDRGGRSITLRPEFTVGVMRAVVQHAQGVQFGPASCRLIEVQPREEVAQRGAIRGTTLGTAE